MKVVIFTWQGGGATQPAFGLGRLLAARGDYVRIIAPAAYADRAAAAGCAHRPFPPAVEFDASAGRAMEDQEEFMVETALGDGLPAVLSRELEAEPADVVVVDYLLRSTVAAAEASGAAVVLLFHMSRRWHGRYSDGDDEWSTPWQFRKLNEYRRELGIEELPDDGTDSVATELARRAAGAVIALPREFDDWEPTPPPHVVHVGPIPEEEAVAAWERPWPEDDERPLVVVTFGTPTCTRRASWRGSRRRSAASTCGPSCSPGSSSSPGTSTSTATWRSAPSSPTRPCCRMPRW